MRAPMPSPDPTAPSPAPETGSAARSGLMAALAAFFIWGFFPLYLKPLAEVPPLQILAHRIAWCCLIVFAWLSVRGELGTVRAALLHRPSLLRLAASAVLVSINCLL